MSEFATGAGSETTAKNRLRLWLRLLKVSRKVESELRENLRREFSTTLPRFDVMAALSRYDKGLKMSALSNVLKVSNGNVTGIVDRLVTDGIIIRTPVPGDKRASLVHLTPKGAEEFARQAKAHEVWVDRLLSGIEADDAESISLLLKQASKRIEQEENGK